jgi:hypothetical protein
MKRYLQLIMATAGMCTAVAFGQQSKLADVKLAVTPEQCVQAQAQCGGLVKPVANAPKPQPRKRAVSLPEGSFVSTASSGLPNATPGQCFARVSYPPEFRDESSQVLKRGASKKTEVIPARFEEREEVVVVREASSRFEVVPASYKTVTEEIVVSEGGKKLQRVPGGVDTSSEQVLVTPARSVWKRGVNVAGMKTKKDSNGDVLCLVEEPAVYRTVTRQVPKADIVREIDIPEVRKTISKVVVDQPATTREVAIPEVTKTVKVRKLAEPAREVSVDVPAEYETAASRTMVHPGGWEWKQVLCETNATPGKLTEIQSALRSKGLQSGTDLKSTLQALNQFRAAQGVRQDDYITVDTLKLLGVTEK